MSLKPEMENLVNSTGYNPMHNSIICTGGGGVVIKTTTECSNFGLSMEKMRV